MHYRIVTKGWVEINYIQSKATSKISQVPNDVQLFRFFCAYRICLQLQFIVTFKQPFDLKSQGGFLPPM